MSLDKAIQHGKEHRKIYRNSKAIDSNCRNHGTCKWCQHNRMYQQLKELESAKQQIQEWNRM